MSPREHAIAAICPLSGEPKTVYEINMVKMLTEFAERVLSAAPQPSGWIKCSERPKQSGSYLVLDSQCDQPFTAFCRIKDRQGNDYHPPQWEYEGYCIGITHWMPLPPKPDAAEGEGK